MLEFKSDCKGLHLKVRAGKKKKESSKVKYWIFHNQAHFLFEDCVCFRFKDRLMEEGITKKLENRVFITV